MGNLQRVQQSRVPLNSQHFCALANKAQSMPYISASLLAAPPLLQR